MLLNSLNVNLEESFQGPYWGLLFKGIIMEKNRDQVIVKTSIIGIVANVLLATFKAIVGLLSSSIAIVLDAVNNLSDALSSLITIIGSKLSHRAPDKKHPLGHGRIEYLSAMVISIIVLYAGLSAFIESFKSILNPETPDYSTITLIIVGVAVIVKIVLGKYVKTKGQQINSDALVASGQDAMFDSIISASTLVAAIIYIFTKVSLEAWLGLIISVIIIKSGYSMLMDTISEILGERVDSDLAKAVKESINSFDEVLGVYDLFIHNYGPEKLIGSAHIEVSNKLSIEQLDELERNIATKVAADCGIIMTGISIYSIDTENEEVSSLLKGIKDIISKYPEVLQIHGFRLKDKKVSFDIIIDFDAKDRMHVYDEVTSKIKEKYPDYDFNIFLDTDISD